jgi:hypothetical protein
MKGGVIMYAFYLSLIREKRHQTFFKKKKETIEKSRKAERRSGLPQTTKRYGK